MKKVFLVVAIGAVSFATVSAQISTGKNSSTVVRTGNRAREGNFGIYFGASTDMFRKITDSGSMGIEHFDALPLINFKYMSTDEVEMRVGLEWYSQTYTDEYKQDTNTDGMSSFMISPGLAYHFNNKNLLDVYMGAEVPIGFGSKSYEYGDSDASASQFKIGLGGFVGLQAYIANLPVAIGVEYGLGMLYNSVSDGHLSQDGMTIIQAVDDVDSSKFELGNQLRFTISYYFDL